MCFSAFVGRGGAGETGVGQLLQNLWANYAKPAVSFLFSHDVVKSQLTLSYFLLKIYWELLNRGVSNGNVSFFLFFPLFFPYDGAVYTLMQ